MTTADHTTTYLAATAATIRDDDPPDPLALHAAGLLTAIAYTRGAAHPATLFDLQRITDAALALANAYNNQRATP